MKYLSRILHTCTSTAPSLAAPAEAPTLRAESARTTTSRALTGPRVAAATTPSTSPTCSFDAESLARSARTIS